MISKFSFLILIGVLMSSFGCSTVPSESVPPQEQLPEPRSPVPEPEERNHIDGPAPRTVASLRLTDQARLLIESKRPDEAIRILEKALNIDPQNGQNYFFLAEAWIQKGNKMQALEFNRMAELYLASYPSWMVRVLQQKERIESLF
jgi:tetratricopeptide (TPR) repeat protein